MVEPESGVGKGAMKSCQVAVSRIIVAIESEIGRGRRGRAGLRSGISNERDCKCSNGHQDKYGSFHQHMLVLAQMGFIPKDAKWYLADIVEEIRVEGDRRNVVHTNLVLVRADSPDEAYEKAMALGKRGNTQYENVEGKTVKIRFRGLRDLNVIHDELEHGGEIIFDRDVGVSEKKIKSWILPKRRLGVFAPIRPHTGPDYGSAEIIREVYERWPYLKGVRGPGYRKPKKQGK